VRYLQEIVKLPDEKIDGFLAALSKADPRFNFQDLAEQIFSPELLSWDLTKGAILVLVSIYRTVDHRGESKERFLDQDVLPSLESAKVLSEDNREEEWTKLRRFLLSALSCERSLGTAAKAGPVQTDHDHIFCEARILTDLRPIYHVEVSEDPTAATVIHMLKITHRDNYSHRYDTFFALDSNDLAALQQTIKRATQKEETLRNIMKDTGVVVLKAGTFF
jgi:hypothetical protein